MVGRTNGPTPFKRCEDASKDVGIDLSHGYSSNYPSRRGPGKKGAGGLSQAKDQTPGRGTELHLLVCWLAGSLARRLWVCCRKKAYQWQIK